MRHVECLYCASPNPIDKTHCGQGEGWGCGAPLPTRYTRAEFQRQAGGPPPDYTLSPYTGAPSEVVHDVHSLTMMLHHGLISKQRARDMLGLAKDTVFGPLDLLG